MTYKTLEVLANEEGEAILQLPDDLILELGWTAGDDLKWTVHEDGSVTLSHVPKTKSDSTEWVLVEAISTFRERYMVQVPKGKAEWALDTVTMNQAKEFSQLHLGETIISHRVVTEEEALTICDQDNDYIKSWNNETKINNMFTTIEDLNDNKD